MLLHDKQLINNLKRFGVVPNKSKTLQPPSLFPKEEKYLPYIIRGIIDGDGSVNSTSYGAPQIRIVTASEDFGKWLKEILTTKLFLNHVTMNKTEHLYVIGTAHSEDMLKVRALIYNKEFGMNRKYKEFKETFRDYNRNLL